MFAGGFAGFDFYFDLSGLTRPKDSRKVHRGASSAWHDGFDFEIGATAIANRDGAHEVLILRLLAEINSLFRSDELWLSPGRIRSRDRFVGLRDVLRWFAWR